MILATGIEDHQPKLENLNELRESGLLRHCPVCDAYELQNKTIAVLAQDTAGIERGTFLRRYT